AADPRPRALVADLPARRRPALDRPRRTGAARNRADALVPALRNLRRQQLQRARPARAEGVRRDPSPAGRSLPARLRRTRLEVRRACAEARGNATARPASAARASRRSRARLSEWRLRRAPAPPW